MIVIKSKEELVNLFKKLAGEEEYLENHEQKIKDKLYYVGRRKVYEELAKLFEDGTFIIECMQAPANEEK